MDNHKTPLRYPGGKKTFYKFVAEILQANRLLGGYYVEPFAGGSGLAIELLVREYVDQIYLNDADPHIFAFWHCLINQTDTLVRMVADAKVDIPEWKKQKEIFDNFSDHTLLEIGFSMFFLNRCNRSGILGGRPIGGLNQTGPWKINARFNKEHLISRIELIGSYRKRIHVYGHDARVFLESENKRFKQNKTLIYLDPPYYIMGGKLYLNYYSHCDHLHLSQFIKALPVKWMLSYDDVSEIRQMYRDKRILTMYLNYRAQTRRKGKELVIFSDELSLPPNFE